MAFNQNIPQATDRLKDSQQDLLDNFQALKQLIDVNHVTFGAAFEGQHKWVTLPDQAANPPVGAFAATDVGLYASIPVAPQPTTGVRELFINKQDGTQIPLTAAELPAVDFPGAGGWAYLGASGLLAKWGSVAIPAVATGVTVSAVQVFPVAANIPAFNNIYLAFAITEQTGVLSYNLVYSLDVTTSTNLQVDFAVRNVGGLNFPGGFAFYLALGI